MHRNNILSYRGYIMCFNILKRVISLYCPFCDFPIFACLSFYLSTQVNLCSFRGKILVFYEGLTSSWHWVILYKTKKCLSIRSSLFLKKDIGSLIKFHILWWVGWIQMSSLRWFWWNSRVLRISRKGLIAIRRIASCPQSKNSGKNLTSWHEIP